MTSRWGQVCNLAHDDGRGGCEKEKKKEGCLGLGGEEKYILFIIWIFDKKKSKINSIETTLN